MSCSVDDAVHTGGAVRAHSITATVVLLHAGVSSKLGEMTNAAEQAMEGATKSSSYGLHIQKRIAALGTEGYQSPDSWFVWNTL